MTLGAAAAVTSRLRFGTGIALVAQRDPLVTAKAIATLDRLCGGRFTLGAGFGWNVEEMRDHGVDYDTRREHAREAILAMRSLWENEKAAFDGRFVQFAESWSWPKPIAQPLPVLMGGTGGPKLFEHIVEYAQGWIPIGGAGLADLVPQLRGLAEQAGRDPAELEIVPFGSHPDHGKLDHFAALGVTECVSGFLPHPGMSCARSWTRRQSWWRSAGSRAGPYRGNEWSLESTSSLADHLPISFAQASGGRCVSRGRRTAVVGGGASFQRQQMWVSSTRGGMARTSIFMLGL